MSAIAAAIASMRAKGIADSVILDVVADMAATETSAPIRTARQERNARYYASQKRLKASESDVSDAFQTVVTDNAPDCPRADLEPTTQEISYPKTPLKGVKKGEVLAPIAKPKSANAECLTELGRVLDPSHAQAVVDHRNRLRKPMTPHAASLLANSFAQAPDPNAAADEMIERGWLGWKPGWGGRSQGPPGRVRENSLLVGIEEIEGFGSNVQHFPRLTG